VGNLLVLGGTAWLGREVARAALDRGHEVTCLARGVSGTVPEGARWVRADRDGDRAYDAVRGTDWDDVVDVSWQPRQVRRAVAALADRAGHWTYVSSCSVYVDHYLRGQGEDAPTFEPLEADTADQEQYGPAKVACERMVHDRLGTRSLLARAGLIGGPGDTSDRFGYWVSRFALAGDGPVLVPESAGHETQTIDVRDLAAWLVREGEDCHHGPVNAVGERCALGDVLALAREVAGHTGDVVEAHTDWLTKRGVTGWAGPRSLPLWLPEPEYAGFGARDDSRARRHGVDRRPLRDTLVDVLADERQRGLDRPRRAGLSRADELELLHELGA
jgi:2'-hydroxyisoflavone reductase